MFLIARVNRPIAAAMIKNALSSCPDMGARYFRACSEGYSPLPLASERSGVTVGLAKGMDGRIDGAVADAAS